MALGRKLANFINDPVGSFDDNDSDMDSYTPRRYRKRHRKARVSRRKYRKSHRKSRRASRHSRRSRSKGGIKYTKNGQPYRILANGRARFIKK